MGSDAGRPRIAYSMGIPEKDLAVVAPHLNEPPKNTPAARRAAEAGAITTQPYVVAIQADGPLPIIDIDATAPTPRRCGAARDRRDRRDPRGRVGP